MFTKNRIGLLLAMLLVVALGLVACQPQSQVVEVTRIVTETITEEGQEVVVTQIVTEVEEVVVTATPEPVEEVVAVSYTHLDVYKRQPPRCSSPTNRPPPST